MSKRKLTEKQEAYCKLLAKLPKRPSLKIRMDAVIEAGFQIKQQDAIKAKVKELSKNLCIIARIEELRDTKAGRPTDYHPRFCEEVIKFFTREPFEVMMVDKDRERVVATDKNGNPIYKPCALPTKEGFANSIGHHVCTCIEWTKKHPEFAEAVKKAESLQKDILIQNGLIGNYEKTFAIFVAKNVTDMRDRKEIDHTSSDESMSPKDVSLLDAKEAAQAYMDIIKQDEY